MSGKETLLQRLEEISQALQNAGGALALLGQGSSGPDLERLDDYSDLDFIIIASPGSKHRFLDRPDWLSAIHPLAYSFKITPEGYKLLFEDGIFCEFAKRLSQFMQGYEGSVESAREILSFLDQNFDINRNIKELILALAEKAAQITPAAEPPAST